MGQVCCRGRVALSRVTARFTSQTGLNKSLTKYEEEEGLLSHLALRTFEARLKRDRCQVRAGLYNQLCTLRADALDLVEVAAYTA